jgi:predicted ATPase
MRIKRLELRNWRNFRDVDVEMASRVFIIGANASGKSNLLEVFRFLHDIATPGGGLEAAVNQRRGVSKIRSLHAKNPARVRIAVTLGDETSDLWMYELEFDRRSSKDDRPRITRERVTYQQKSLLDRPMIDDRKDSERLHQTALEQTNSNREFRRVADFFRSIEYTNLVPQLIREPGNSGPDWVIGSDPLGRDFLQRIRETTPKKRNARLRQISSVLSKVVPSFKKLEFEESDAHGRPHLVAGFKHWRGPLAQQQESEFSDGTLRLIAMLWLLQEDGGPLLLDEPEWSLHTAILKQLAGMLSRATSQAGEDRQVIVATHSEQLLYDTGIGSEELLLILPANEGSEVKVGATIQAISKAMSSGLSAAEVALPRTAPKQHLLFPS